MLKIIFGLLFQAAGYGFIYAMFHASGNEGFIFFGLGAAGTVGGIILFLSGLREYFLDGIHNELKIISGTGITVFKAYKKCTSCAEMVRADAKICRFCDREDFITQS